MTIYVVDLEKIETRYTSQWYDHIPKLLRRHNFNVEVISGPTDIPPATTPGAFLNFGGTNIYKSKQIEKISRLFCDGIIKDGDYFLFTDAWHPGVINLKYMAELLGVKVKIGGLWHAGSYDKHDFLGRLISNAPWVRYAEKSFYHAYDHNYFATEFHIEMFFEELINDGVKAENPYYEVDLSEACANKKIVRTGWPMEYMENTLDLYSKLIKRDLILFPHRIAPEKQVEIFRDLAQQLPQYEFIVCQDQQLTKHQYHTLLGESKIVFSANLQETLGISTCSEGPLAGAIPLVPNRLSYTEIYRNYEQFLYPEVWTADWQSYLKHREDLKTVITDLMNNYELNRPLVNNYIRNEYNNYFSAKNLLETIV